MRARKLLLAGWLLLAGLWLAPSASAQGWGRVEGTVEERGSGLPLPGVTILVDGTDFGTASDEAGRYVLRLPRGRHALRFSAVGFTARVDSVTIRPDDFNELSDDLRIRDDD